MTHPGPGRSTQDIETRRAPQGRSPKAGGGEGSTTWCLVHEDRKPGSSGALGVKWEEARAVVVLGQDRPPRGAGTELAPGFSQLSGLTTSYCKTWARLTRLPQSQQGFPDTHTLPRDLQEVPTQACGCQATGAGCLPAGSFSVQRPQGLTPAESALSTV